MSLETNTVKLDPNKYGVTGGRIDVTRGFPAVFADDGGYFVHPLSGLAICSQAISLSIDYEDVIVEYADGSVAVIPAGVLEMGVKHPMNIVKVFETGSGSNVEVFVWIE